MSKDIIKTINSLENLKYTKPATMDEIRKAESDLHLKFAEDYIQYVSTYGVVSAKRIELTGITSINRLNVVKVTQKERILNPNIPGNMYIIENIAYEGMLFLQDQTGAVYFITPNNKPRKVYDSLSDYIEDL